MINPVNLIFLDKVHPAYNTRRATQDASLSCLSNPELVSDIYQVDIKGVSMGASKPE